MRSEGNQEVSILNNENLNVIQLGSLVSGDYNISNKESAHIGSMLSNQFHLKQTESGLVALAQVVRNQQRQDLGESYEKKNEAQVRQDAIKKVTVGVSELDRPKKSFMSAMPKLDIANEQIKSEESFEKYAKRDDSQFRSPRMVEIELQQIELQDLEQNGDHQVQDSD